MAYNHSEETKARMKAGLTGRTYKMRSSKLVERGSIERVTKEGIRLTDNQCVWLRPGEAHLVEGYWAMVADKAANPERRWCLHHRKEINTITGETKTREELQAADEYNHVPHNELIWMTLEAHVKLHKPSQHIKHPFGRGK